MSGGAGPEGARPTGSGPRDPIVTATAVALAAIGVVHVGWGLRLPLPGVDPARVADAVVGSDELPPPAACLAVAGALGVASALVAGAPPSRPGVRRLGQVGVATVLGARGLVGLAGRTEILAPGPTSERFRRWDRLVYTPLCLSLSAGALRAARHDKPHRTGVEAQRVP